MGNQFLLGEVWLSPRGCFYRVVGHEETPGKRPQAVLRKGVQGAGRKQRRDWDDVMNWTLHMRQDGTLTLAAPATLQDWRDQHPAPSHGCGHMQGRR